MYNYCEFKPFIINNLSFFKLLLYNKYNEPTLNNCLILSSIKKRKMKFDKGDIKTGLIVLVAVMAGLAVHQVFVAPRLAKRVKG